MVFLQMIAAVNAIIAIVGIPGNLLVMITIAFEERFHVMRYILLASLALSDFLCLIFINSFRIASFAYENWLYGDTMCQLNAFLARYFYLNTVLHLVAISYERYDAIVKSPLTYDGTITKWKVLLIFLLWVFPILPFVVVLFQFEGYKYDPELIFCDLGHVAQSASSGVKTLAAVFPSVLLVGPFLIIALLNWLVYKTARNQVEALGHRQLGGIAGSNPEQQEIPKRVRERKAAVDIIIIVAAFWLCFFPMYIVRLFRLFWKFGTKVPAEAILVSSSVFLISSLCNPIIYSVRKREFRLGVKNLLRRSGLWKFQGDHNDEFIAMNNLRFPRCIPDRNSMHQEAPLTDHASEDQHRSAMFVSMMELTRLKFESRLSPIPENAEEDK